MQGGETVDGALPAGGRVAVSGASGLVGGAVVDRLRAEGFDVLRLVRREPAAGEVRWDPEAGRIDDAALEGVDAVVHLAGENLAERWTAERKRRIRASRGEATRFLAGALAGLARTPKVLVSASAMGLYGDRGDEVLGDDASPGSGFLAEVVREWEAGAQPAAQAGIRVVHLRFGLVLSAAGGALPKLLPPFRMGVGGPIGDGKQWMSWLTRDDAVDAILFALRTPTFHGAANAVAGAVRNEDFAQTLGHVLNRPAFVPVPTFALRLAFGEMADATLLASQRVESHRLREAGFRFRNDDLEPALRAALADD